MRSSCSMRTRLAPALCFALAAAGLLAAVACAGVRAATPTPGPVPGIAPHPFAPTSIWIRQIPADAVYADVHDAIYGDPAYAPTSAGADLVTICATDAAAPLTNIELSQGWTLPARSQSTGQVLYQRRLAPDACAGVTWNPIGNALFVLVDPATGLADLGVGGWRDPGGPLLNVANDGVGAHGVDTVNGDGIRGYGRASSLPALGGAIRPGELTNGIEHAVAVNVPVIRLSAARHFTWPAQSADASAPAAYQGPDPNYTMGALLAIPPGVDLNALTWRTSQGLALARAAQRYGWYIVDAVPAAQLQLAFDNDAALIDLGLSVDPATGAQTVDPAKIDGQAFVDDVLQVLAHASAVVSNAPSTGGVAEPPAALPPPSRPASGRRYLLALLGAGATLVLAAVSWAMWRRRRAA